MQSGGSARTDRFRFAGGTAWINSPLRSSPTPRQPSSGHVSRALAPPWPFNPEETALINAGYAPKYTPPSPSNLDSESYHSKKPRSSKMAEPRARAPRHKGQMNFQNERTYLLFSFILILLVC